MNLLEGARHFFVPRHSNNHKAKILHPSTLSAIVALFLVSQFLINFSALMMPSVLGFASNITPERVIELTNQKRAEQGLPPLSLDVQLNEAAQRKAGDMFAFNYWAHNSPSGRNPWSFFREVGYKYLFAGENLARDFMNSESVVEAWMNSPTHRENILNAKYQEIGLAVVNGTLDGVETTLVVQLFGTPTPAPVPVASQPTSSVPKLGESVKEEVVIEEEEEEEITLIPAAIAQVEEGTSFHPLVSPFSITKTMAIFLFGLALGALVLDVVFISRKRVVRLSSRTLAHLIFVSFLLLAVVITTQGAIL
jgi:hypothetical protein